jgi:FtsH-binding integral membrane protein
MFGALFTFASAFFVLNAAYQLNIQLEVASSYDYSSIGDVFGVIVAPIANLFLWLAFMVLGLSLYRSDRTILPLEEDIVDYPSPAKKAKKK